MKIIIASNKPLPIKLEQNVLFERGKIKPYFLRHSFFVEVTLQNETEYGAIEQYIFDLLSQYKNAEIELHSETKSIYRHMLAHHCQLTYLCGSLYFYSAKKETIDN